VWQEDGEGDSFYHDGERELTIHGTTDYYTKDEYDENLDKLNELHQEVMHAWTINSIQYEEDTGFIHYEWEWTVSQIG